MNLQCELASKRCSCCLQKQLSAWLQLGVAMSRNLNCGVSWNACIYTISTLKWWYYSINTN